MRVTGDVASQQSTAGGCPNQEEEVEVAEAAPGLGGEVIATVVAVVLVAVPEQVVDDDVTRVEELVAKRKTENVASHGDLVKEKMAQARVFLDNARLQRDMKKAVNKK